jgi:hypothetical protein
VHHAPIHDIRPWSQRWDVGQTNPCAGVGDAKPWAQHIVFDRSLPYCLHEHFIRARQSIAQLNLCPRGKDLTPPDNFEGPTERGERFPAADGLHDGRAVREHALHNEGEGHEGNECYPSNSRTPINGAAQIRSREARHCAERCTTMPALGFMRRRARIRS